MTTSLPEGWATIRIGDYFHSWGGMTPSTSNASYWGGKVPWVSSKDIKAWRLAGGEDFITPKALHETRLRLCPVGSVLVVVRSGILAHTLPIAVVDMPVSINQDLKAFYCTDSDMNEWLALALRALAPEILTNNRKDGTTVQSVRYEELCDLRIQVPPSHEQRRITARLGNLMDKVGSTRGRLSQVPATLKRFRRAVLAAACSGRLTEDWPKSHPDHETVEQLLEAVLAERESAWGRGKYRTPAEIEANDLPEIPDHWQYVSFDTLVSDSFYGPRFSADDYSNSNEGTPTIRTTDITFNGGLDLHDPPRIRLSTEELRDLGLKHEDLLVTRTGATIGKCALYEEEMGPAIPSAYLIRFRLTRRAVPPRYVLMFLMSPVGQRLLLGGSTAVAQPNVNAKNISRFPVPLPPQDEIREIVARVEALLETADVVEEHLLTATASVDKLTQSILAKAFLGELIPTEAELARIEGREYEPASVLLERIKKERNSGTTPMATRQRSQSKGTLASAKGS